MTDNPHILIIEDDPDIRLGWSVYLQREFDVTLAEDSISGLMAARRRRPDAIVLDLGLPGGDGLQLLERLRAIPALAQVPVVVCSGRDAREFEPSVRRAGASRAFQKPIDLTDLHAALREVLAEPCTPTRTALVVDDDDDTREALSVRLRSLGFTVATSADGASALIQARRERPDVMLLDLGLPCGGGMQVLDRLRSIEELRSVPVIVVSGQEGAEVRREAFDAGARAFVQKPADENELVDNVLAVL